MPGTGRVVRYLRQLFAFAPGASNPMQESGALLAVPPQGLQACTKKRQQLKKPAALKVQPSPIDPRTSPSTTITAAPRAAAGELGVGVAWFPLGHPCCKVGPHPPGKYGGRSGVDQHLQLGLPVGARVAGWAQGWFRRPSSICCDMVLLKVSMNSNNKLEALNKCLVPWARKWATNTLVASGGT